jgi:hypothetical protein
MKIFLSSVIASFEAYREAAADAITSLGYQVLRAEDFPAQAQTPQRACLGAVREADVVVLVLGERYGATQESGLSATHEEYREARGTRPVLAFVQEGVDREPRQREFVKEVEGWVGGALRSGFADAAGLRRAVTKALHRFGVSQAQGAPDADEMCSRARALLEHRRDSSEAVIALAIAAGPRQTILRPAEIENPELARWVLQALLFGPNAVFDERQGNDQQTDAQALEVTQQRGARLLLNAEGSLRMLIPARRRESDRWGFALIEEDVREILVRSLRLAAQVLDHVDPSGRITRVALAAATPGAEHMGWQTRAEAAASGGSVRVAMFGGEQPVHLSPPDRVRAALTFEAEPIAEDLTILLRRARGL